MRITTDDMDVLARTIWGEARGEGGEGMLAVAAVVLNRWRDNRWPGSIAAVCWQPKQFSCWNEGDPNRAKMERLTIDKRSFHAAFLAALHSLTMPDPTDGANHYYAITIRPPSWSRRMSETARIGRHVFLKG